MKAYVQPLIIAHRGFHLDGIPENTVEAMRAANAVADGVEFDVRQTRDRVLVLNHDAIAFGLPVAQTDFPTLRAVSEKNNAPIPTLEEAVAVIDDGKFVVAEVKVGGIAERVVAVCRPKFDEKFRIGSFRFSDISKAPKEVRWLIVFHALQAWPYRASIRGIDCGAGGWWVKRWGLESAVWTVNNPIQSLRLAKSGVQYCTTDNPVGLAGEIRKRDLVVKKTKNGKGVFSQRAFDTGERILDFHGLILQREKLPYPYANDEDHYIQIGPDTYMGPSGDVDDYFNHSCDPNAGLHVNGTSVRLVAIREIEPGEEIRFDYSTTMNEDDWEMDCSCGAKKCRKRIRDFKYLPIERQEYYKKLGIVPDFVLTSISARSPGGW